MCGIAGIFDPRGNQGIVDISEVVTRMSDRLRHRGPDSDGTWADSDGGIAFGHRRLAVQDISKTGNQPMQSVNGRYMIVLNGEIYNFKDLRCILESMGHRFRGCSDTEVLLASIVEWGLDATLDRIHGMFAFALWDRNNQCLKLVRDRLGEKPLYYSTAGEKFIFASELKALSECPWWRPPIDRESLRQYFRFNYVPDPMCIFKETRKLLPGCVLTIKSRDFPALTLEPFWQLTHNSSVSLDVLDKKSPGQIVDMFHEVLYDSVERQLISDVPIGTFLSGGIDSSLITALAQEATGNTVKTFTVAFREKKYDESLYAREVANILKTNHTEVTLGEEDALDLVPELPTIYDEPFGDSSQLPTILVSRVARQHVTVALGGDGGDELMAGYNRYFSALPRIKNWHMTIAKSKLKKMSIELMQKIGRGSLAAAISCLKNKSYDAVLIDRKLRSIAELSRDRSPASIYMRYVSFWLNCMNPAGAMSLDQMGSISESDSWSDDPLKAMMLFDASTYLPGDILTKVDRAAMSVSLETRLPLLDHEVVNLCLHIPSKIHMMDGRGKWLGRQALSKYLPSHLLDRKKTGFAAPVDEWLRGPLRNWADILLAKERLVDQGILDAEVVAQEWQWQKSGQINRGQSLWGVLMFQAWINNKNIHDVRSVEVDFQ